MNSRARALRPEALRIRKARVDDAAILCAAERETARESGRLVSRPHELAEQAFAARIAALRLYRKFGFIEEGRSRRRIGLADGACLDDICMAWLAAEAEVSS